MGGYTVPLTRPLYPNFEENASEEAASEKASNWRRQTGDSAFPNKMVPEVKSSVPVKRIHNFTSMKAGEKSCRNPDCLVF